MAEKVSHTTKPLQRLSYAEKIANNHKWFKEVADYLIGNSPHINSFMITDSSKNNFNVELNSLIGIYHNEIPASLFKTFTNPINATNEKYEVKNAKIRPLNIIKANVDFINSNYAKRVFNYQCVNLDVDAYNEYQEKIKEQMLQRITQRFAQLITSESGEQEQQDFTPSKIKEELSLSYKDIIADKMQSYLNGMVKQNHVHESLCDIFLDYLIGGEPVSFRGIVNGKFSYRRIARNFFSYGKSPNEKYIENSEWQLEVEFKTVSDIVNDYYDKLDNKSWEQLDKVSGLSPDNFKLFLQNVCINTDNPTYRNLTGKIPVYHCYWVSRKKVGKRVGIDENGIVSVDEVDENYEVDESIEQVEWYWKDCIYQTDRIANAIYINMGEYDYDFSDISADGKIRMPYNGFKFAHYYDDKIYSVLKMGIPYLTMFLICNFMVERLLAKNKDRILLIDFNVIPKVDGWDEERFLYYAHELGYAFLDRSNQDVDKTFNQYTSVDMSTLGSIMDMINLADRYKGLWDDIIGIPRQMRGQTYASDQVGTTQSAIAQSGIGIDYIYQKFDNFVNREFEYFLELAKYLIIDNNGHNSVEYSDDLFKLLNIKPEEIYPSKLKILPVNNSKENKELEEAKQYAKTVNQQDPLTIVEILTADSISTLKKKLNTIAKNISEQQKQVAESEHANKKELVEMQKEIKEFEHILNKDLENLKSANKIKENQAISGNTQQVDINKNGIADSVEATLKNNVDMQRLALDAKIADDNKEVSLKKIEADKQKAKSKS